jgi:hypothetical protein
MRKKSRVSGWDSLAALYCRIAGERAAESVLKMLDDDSCDIPRMVRITHRGGWTYPHPVY